MQRNGYSKRDAETALSSTTARVAVNIGRSLAGLVRLVGLVGLPGLAGLTE
ncbi:hypothetical protein [Paenibacillus sp. FSL H8-0259]|uniref:hypothetical protein n=1 Tax=Paenibacillus sp. FSL H8-0259 TaxID=1920423 RepID=UPI0015C37354|nr:hypothetical protein [Paenibacillus sp. FSL H8-0259]